eukprot:CAMPEP_0168321038 /NCGR_PEP_ID=MMETSP0213-20121227/2030_1 /TAXON_ID=151035 /ORGANISM="Euplotes harpa, Strain FSP1.4" /LENGTH=190 /DNA_ID=CAMNT_0008322607 /DNA_START=2006 /DNA_END=2578 /DNA_ORIENTATION=-
MVSGTNISISHHESLHMDDERYSKEESKGYLMEDSMKVSQNAYRSSPTFRMKITKIKDTLKDKIDRSSFEEAVTLRDPYKSQTPDLGMHANEGLRWSHRKPSPFFGQFKPSQVAFNTRRNFELSNRLQLHNEGDHEFDYTDVRDRRRSPWPVVENLYMNSHRNSSIENEDTPRRSAMEKRKKNYKEDMLF